MKSRAPWRSGRIARVSCWEPSGPCARSAPHARSAGNSSAPSAAWGVNFSGDGEVLAVAYGDGTIRWRRWSDGQELLALFVDATDRSWVAWTPTGYYMASPGGEDLIGWHVNRGWAQQADFFPASRFSARFNRPDIVQLVLKTRDEAEAIKQANETAKRKQDTTPIAAAAAAGGDDRFAAPMATSSAATLSRSNSNVRSPSGLPVDRVDALIDGRPVEARGLAPASATRRDDTRTLTIPAPAHDFELAVVARSGELVGDAAKVRLRYARAPANPRTRSNPSSTWSRSASATMPTPTCASPTPPPTRAASPTAMQKQEGGLYAQVEVRTLVDRDATRANVLDALDGSTASDQPRHRHADDGGHGVTDEKGRLLVPARRRLAETPRRDRGLAGRHPPRHERASRARRSCFSTPATPTAR